MRQFDKMQVHIALIRDGFHPDSVGGTVEINKWGDPVLDYPVSDFIWDGAKRAHLTMAELQFAVGAKKVFPIHKKASAYSSWPEAKAAIEQLPFEKYWSTLVSAHVMGGCNMGESDRLAVVDSFGNHRQLENLSIFDGSVFPTSLGANPQLSILRAGLS